MEWARLTGFYGFILLLHIAGWGLFLHYQRGYGAAYAAAGILAYSIGLRHAFDADHISAVDDTTRLFVQRGGKPLGVGFFFSLGHSTIVFLLTSILAIAAHFIQQNLGGWQNIGSFVGATVSGSFLWIVGIFNLFVFTGIWRVYRQIKSGRYQPEELEELLTKRGFMNRLLGGRFRKFVSRSWHMYFVGLLFGLGFDTASQVGLLAITAAAATTGGGLQAGLPVLGIIALPLLFAAGMSLMDTTDGVFMSRAYRWAFTTPLRKVYYNLTTTGLSVFVALAVGTIEYLQVASNALDLKNAFFNWLSRLDFATLGYVIVGTFLIIWIGSMVLFRLSHTEEHWARQVAEENGKPRSPPPGDNP